MIWAVALAVWVTVTVGVYLALSRDALRVVLGLAVLGSAINLLLFASGRLGSALPAVVPLGDEVLASNAANPLPQALVLTAIVIAFGMTAVVVLLALGAYLAGGDERIDIARPDTAGGTGAEGRA